MANLIKQKYLEGIDSSKFKIEQGGAIKAVNASGTLVDVFKFDTAQNIVKIYNDKQVADTDFVNGLINQEITNRNDAISQAISDLINGAPAALDTLREISDALAEDQTALDGLLESLTEYVKLDGSRAFTDDLPMGNNKITGLANGQLFDEAVNKGQLDSGVQEAKDYTDNLEDRSMLLNGSQAMLENLPMGSKKITGLANGQMFDEAVNKGQLDSGVQEAKDYTDNLEDRVMLLNGSQAMLENLPMGSKKITGLANGQMFDEAINKGQLDSGVQEAKDYTDNLEDRVMLLNGSQAMTENLPMGSKKITGLANGQMFDEAVNKGQLDSVEQGLQSQITTEKDRVDAILSMSQADKDSFVEIVDLINSIDTGNSDALAGHLVDAEDAHDASAISVVPAGNLAATQVQGALEELQVHIDTVEQSVTNLDAYAQEVRSDLDAEIADRGAADVVLQGNIDTEVAALEAEDLTLVKLDGSRVMTGNFDIGGFNAITSKILVDGEGENTSGTNIISTVKFGTEALAETNAVGPRPFLFLKGEDVDPTVGYYGSSPDEFGVNQVLYQQATFLPNFIDVRAPNYTIENKWGTLNLNAGNGSEISIGSNGNSVISKFFGAITEFHTEIKSLTVQGFTQYSTDYDYAAGTSTSQLRIGMDLDTGLIPVIDLGAKTKINGETGIITNKVLLQDENGVAIVPVAAEEAVNKAYVDSQISEAKDFAKQTFEIDVASELQYVILSQQAVENSLVVFVNRLALHQGIDYTVSVYFDPASYEAAPQTKITWMGDFAVGGVEAIEEGDVINVTYMY